MYKTPCTIPRRANTLTAKAVGSLHQRLQSVQANGEAQAVAQGALVACTVVGVIDVGSLVATALADAPVSVPVAVADSAEIASDAAETTGIISTIQGILAAIDGVITSIPVWQWQSSCLAALPSCRRKEGLLQIQTSNRNSRRRWPNSAFR